MKDIGKTIDEDRCGGDGGKTEVGVDGQCGCGLDGEETVEMQNRLCSGNLSEPSTPHRGGKIICSGRRWLKRRSEQFAIR